MGRTFSRCPGFSEPPCAAPEFHRAISGGQRAVVRARRSGFGLPLHAGGLAGPDHSFHRNRSLPRYGDSLARRRSGGLACAGAGPTVRRVYRLGALLLVCLLAALGLSLWQGLVLIVAQYCLTRRLAAQARSHGGLSGDFLGAAIELGQLWFLLATL